MDPSRGGPGAEVTMGLASSPDEVLDAVRSWLDDFVTGPIDGDR